jgi:glycosyltransferase involved in cell wall biosynthesis
VLIVGRQWQDGTSDYRKIIENYDVQGSTIWINERIDDDIVNLYFKSSDIVVLPYTEIYSSGVLLRAIGYKKPLIVSDQEAFLEVVDKESAFIFKTGSVSNLTDTLKTSIEDQDLRNKAQLKLTKLIDEKYSWNKIGKVMREYFLWVHENEVNQ